MRAGSLPPPTLHCHSLPQQSPRGRAPERWGWGEGNLGRRLLHGVGRDQSSQRQSPSMALCIRAAITVLRNTIPVLLLTCR